MVVTLTNWLAADQRVFRKKQKDIQGALKGNTGIIGGVTEEHEEDIFYMLMFCLCVPQSKAIKAEEAIDVLRKRDYFNKDLSLDEVVEVLKGRVRFQSTKAKRLVEARKMFFLTEFWEKLQKAHIEVDGTSGEVREIILQGTRRTLIKTINGMGMKLASHFMRNVGMGGLAILDVHIIAGLKKRKVIDIDKLGPSQAEYLEIEQTMKDYADQVGITLDELDLLLWSQKTGYVFK